MNWSRYELVQRSQKRGLLMARLGTKESSKYPSVLADSRILPACQSGCL